MLLVPVCGGGTSAVATPMQEPQIASLFSASTRYGPSEAGKRAQEPIVIIVSDSSGAPIAGARWRWRTDTHAGWVCILSPGPRLPTAASP